MLQGKRRRCPQRGDFSFLLISSYTAANFFIEKPSVYGLG